jgi:hypothetical protein
MMMFRRRGESTSEKFQEGFCIDTSSSETKSNQIKALYLIISSFSSGLHASQIATSQSTAET